MLWFSQESKAGVLCVARFCSLGGLGNDDGMPDLELWEVSMSNLVYGKKICVYMGLGVLEAMPDLGTEVESLLWTG